MTMSRPRLNDELTIENVLDRMRPGYAYQANQIASKFHLATAEIRPLLESMVAAGQLELCRANTKWLGFRRPSGDVPKKPVPIVPTDDGVVLSIAGPRAIDPMVGNLVGYDAEISRRMQLCMLARGAR